jgi:hypothetical protein
MTYIKVLNIKKESHISKMFINSLPHKYHQTARLWQTSPGNHNFNNIVALQKYIKLIHNKKNEVFCYVKQHWDNKSQEDILDSHYIKSLTDRNLSNIHSNPHTCNWPFNRGRWGGGKEKKNWVGWQVQQHNYTRTQDTQCTA